MCACGNRRAASVNCATAFGAIPDGALTVGKLSAALLLVTALGGCVTDGSIPNSPFLTAVVRLKPTAVGSNATIAAAGSASSPLDANAQVIDLPLRGSIFQTALGPMAGEVPPPAPKPPPFVAPVPERSQVFPQIAAAQSPLVASVAPAMMSDAGPRRPNESPVRGGKSVLLGEAVGVAVLSHPLMGAQAAKVSGSLADVRTAQGALKPQLQVFAGAGGSYLGSYQNYPQQFGSVAIPGGSRTDAGFTLRQLVYDFGAAKADVARSRSVVDAERLRLADQAEDIALRTVNAYLNLLEQRELIALMDKVVADDNAFANLVKLSEQQGNGTIADVSRIRSKVIEVEAVRTDLLTSMKAAEDEFSRLTKIDPALVRQSPRGPPRIPASFDVALEAAKRSNPSLLAFSATGASIEHQLASQQSQRLPRVDLQGDGLVKHYVGAPTASQGIVDSRLMLMVSYKLLDGGTMSAQADRIREDKRANDFKTLDEKETIELNLRRFYQALASNRIKESAALQGTATAQKANSLYLEQFKAGKRTVFEVLDSRMVVFTMQKNAVNGRYEQMRAGYGILRNMGKLVEAAVNFPAG
ncbi:TolC family protein [Bradyrhizobium roseum]|uniref:TolC family protein n=1 Tax=Bradyrhizobium roseum TaxID=3056648 RepID=UPI00263714BF|nr:TolC family protein [Bradyrhizobium roseus]WKA29113.1 TolC family protein [Bradyrhizobium roseus]